MFCNTREFGPPKCVTIFSTCSSRDHSVSGQIHTAIFNPFFRVRRNTFHVCVYWASTSRLKRAVWIYSLTHYAKGTPSLCSLSKSVSQKKKTSKVSSLMRNMKFRLFVNFEFQDSISLPSKGFFSPFPHGTCSLLVKEEYLGFEGGPPIFKQENSLYFFSPEKKWSYRVFTFFDKIFQSFLSFFSFWNSPTWVRKFRPFPGSLATTTRISVDL